MKRFISIILFLSVLSASFISGFFIAFKIYSFQQSVAYYPSDLNTDTLLALVSQYRIQNNLSPLKKSDLLCQMAQTRVNQLVSTAEFSHAGYWSLSTSYHNNFKILGENLARRFTFNKDILDAWLKSPTHRNNIMFPNFSQACVTMGNQYVVMIYGDPS